jgi:hypothetical protein
MSTPGSNATPRGDDPKSPATPEAWQATRAQTALATQFMRNEEDYLAAEVRDIGRQINANERELFVSCDPALAMQQQFEHLNPEFIAIHDIGTTSSRKLLAGVAAASGRSIQKLFIRRQGYGTPLATLEYVELPPPTALRCACTRPRPMPTRSRAKASRACCSHSAASG